MSSNCLSTASILRCNALSRYQNSVIFIPPVIQALLATALVASRWGSGRKHYLLAADAWVFFVVTLFDLLSHQLPIAREDVNVFKVFDIFIGVLSFIPIALYTTFLFVLMQRAFIPLLPRRFQKLAKYTLLVFIPVTAATNEVGSFVGITYLRLQDILGRTVLAISFRNSGEQAVWQFFTSITLAMLLAFQSVVFALSIYHFLKPYLGRSRLETPSNDLQPYVVKGAGWVALGVKLGVVETILGFVNGGFDVILARRILRLLSRTCMLIAVFTGLDGFEDFRPKGGRSRGRSVSKTKLRGMISNPRNSTFARLSVGATGFYSLPRANAQYDEADTREVKRQQRVTVHYGDGATPPTLEMRLSDLDMPSPETLTATFNKRGTLVVEKRRGGDDNSEKFDLEDEKVLLKTPQQLRVVSKGSSASFVTYSAIATPEAAALRTFTYSTQARQPVDTVRGIGTSNGTGGVLPYMRRHVSAENAALDDLDAVHKIEAQLTGIPLRTTRVSDVAEEDPSYSSLTRTSSSTRPRTASMDTLASDPFAEKPPAGASANAGIGVIVAARKSSSTHLRSSSSIKRKAVPKPPPIDATIARPQVQVQINTGTTTTASNENRGSYSNTASSRTSSSSTLRHTPHDPFLSDSHILRTQSGLGVIAARVTELERRRAALTQPSQPRGEASDPFGDSASVTRIKSIGRVQTHTTPTPSQSVFVRKSLRIEPGDLEEALRDRDVCPGNTAATPSSASKGKTPMRGDGTRKDSERSYTRRPNYDDYAVRERRVRDGDEFEM